MTTSSHIPAGSQSFAVTESCRGMRLDRFLQQMLPRMSRTSIQAAIACRVRLASGGQPKPSRRLAVGDVAIIEPRSAAARAAVARSPSSGSR